MCEVYIPKRPWRITIFMIPLHPHGLLAVRGLPNEFQNPFVHRLQFYVRDVNDIPIKDELMVLGNTSQKTLEVLI